MTDKPRTFDIKFDSAGDFDKARELIERMNAELEAERDSIKQQWDALQDRLHSEFVAKTALQAQIDRVRALAEQWQTKSYDPSHFEERGCCHSYCVSDLLTALGEPAATPEREP